MIQFESFRKALKYKFTKEDENIYQSSLDGESHKRNMREMEETFQTYKSTLPSDDNDVEPIYMTGSWFYDGVQLFKTAMSDTAPIFISFHNLPHCLKNKHGIGSFLLSLFTFKKGSPVEDFLMNDCFISELKDLSEGFVAVLDNIRYYVIFRLICHIQDLIGFNSQLKSW